jgi:hypothetical protein
VKLYRFVFLFALIAAPVSAQSRSDIVAQAIFDVSGRETATASDWCQVLKVSNLVAWRLWTNHAAPAPYRLAAQGGRHARRPAAGRELHRRATHERTERLRARLRHRPEHRLRPRHRDELGRGAVARAGDGGRYGCAQLPRLPRAVRSGVVSRRADRSRRSCDAGGRAAGQPPPVFDAAALAAQIAQLQLALDTHARGLSEAIAVVNQNVTDGREREPQRLARRSPTTGSRS